MAKTRATRTPKGKGKDTGRKVKKKVSVLDSEQIDYVDWKDVNLLRRFVSDRAKVRARRVTGNDVQQQREVARAIKNAREMALLPYSTRVTTQRGGRRGDRDRDGGERRERPERAEAEATETATTGAPSEFNELETAPAAATDTSGGEQ